MAEETKEQQSTKVVAIEPVAATGQESKTGGNNRGDNRRGDRLPIEEMFDLTKPIPRVDRPDKEGHEDDIAALNVEIDNLKDKRRDVQNKIDSSMDTRGGSAVMKEREILNRLHGQKRSLINEKKTIRARLDKIKNQSEKIFEDKRRTKDSMRYTKLEDIEAQLKKLQITQETTSMSLSQEKKLLKEMSLLTASKKLVMQLKTKETDLEDVREQRKNISAEIAAKDKEIDEVQRQIDTQNVVVKSLSEKENEGRDKVSDMISERDEVKKEMNDKMQERNQKRDDFREINNKWYDYQRAVREQKKVQYEEEKKQKEEERAVWLKEKEEEELKKVPYEEEMALCDYLADYLTKTYIKSTESKEEKKKEDVVPVKDDPFAGMMALKKNEDEVFLKMGKGKKSKPRQAKKVKKPVKFTLNVDTFEQFGLLNLNPPTNHDGVEASIESLRAKKTWYSEQPRGSVKTATEIRKANEKAAQGTKQKKSSNGGASAVAKGPTKKGGQFALTSDDFAPLAGGAAASSAVNASWGKSGGEEYPAPEVGATEIEA